MSFPLSYSDLGDWSRFEAFDWVRAMATCPQSPLFHAEGDVWTHTKMVLERLIQSEAWIHSSEQAKEILFWACLLHDVAKPETTRREADGFLSARGHSRAGAIRVRNLLWQWGIPFDTREAIARLILVHQVPFFLVNDSDGERKLSKLSLHTRLDWLNEVAMADMRGRICEDSLAQEEALTNIALFSDWAKELGLWNQPASFASPHTRVQYCLGKWHQRDVVPHESFRCTATVMVGLPGMGKDTWIRNHATEMPVVSLDAWRKKLKIKPSDEQGQVVQAAREEVRSYLRAGKDFVWNATHLSRAQRQQNIDLLLDYQAYVRLVYVEVPFNEHQHQNRERENAVPQAALTRMASKWEVPDLTEAHEIILHVT